MSATTPDVEEIARKHAEKLCIDDKRAEKYVAATIVEAITQAREPLVAALRSVTDFNLSPNWQRNTESLIQVRQICRAALTGTAEKK